jgi:hypothetical protein
MNSAVWLIDRETMTDPQEPTKVHDHCWRNSRRRLAVTGCGCALVLGAQHCLGTQPIGQGALAN